MISKADGKRLIALARESIMASFSGGEVEVPLELSARFSAPQGGFVTLTIKGQLRGCIGYAEPVFPLYETIMRAAHSAAFEDSRFSPISEEEFKQVRIEISALTVPELMAADKPEDYLKKIRIGQDGLIIRGRFGSGLLLPQVFREYKCNPRAALEMTCEKAGLPLDAWMEPGNKVFRFQAEIFSEKA
jgi:AmmeMemoRadiSam system protein A